MLGIVRQEYCNIILNILINEINFFIILIKKYQKMPKNTKKCQKMQKNAKKIPKNKIRIK